MWVLSPASSDLMWSISKENAFFALQEHASVRHGFYGVMASLIAVNYPYRILLKGSTKAASQIIAVAEEYSGIEDHWKFLEDHLIPACSLFDRGVPAEESELWRFLLSKIKSLADLERGGKEKESMEPQRQEIKLAIEASPVRDSRQRQKELAIKKREQNAAARRRNWLKLSPMAAKHELIHGILLSQAFKLIGLIIFI